MNSFSTVSSDDILASYQEQLSEAHHRIAILQAQLAQAARFINEPRTGPVETHGGEDSQ